MTFLNQIRYFFETRGFAVSSRLAEKLGLKTRSIRLFFIYMSFATLGGWFGIYLILAFIIRIKDLFYTKRSSVFDF